MTVGPAGQRSSARANIEAGASLARGAKVESEIAAKLRDALRLREALSADPHTDCYRLLHGSADGLPGLVIEKYGPVLIVQFHEGRLTLPPERLRPAIEGLHAELGTRAVYAKWFVRDRAKGGERHAAAHREATPWIGEAVEPEVNVRENGLHFLVRPYDGFSVGLFLDQRDNRRRIRELARGRRVLNAFSYTGGFSVAAAVGGAIGVDSVDVSRRYLEWSKRNFSVNGLAERAGRFFCSDVLSFFRRALRQGRRYELIVLDPPTFSRQRRPDHVFVLFEQLEELLAGAAELLDPPGVLFFSTNERALPYDTIERALAARLGHGGCRIIERPALPIDFAGDPDYSRALFVEIAGERRASQPRGDA